jgi:hypothetical protein
MIFRVIDNTTGEPIELDGQIDLRLSQAQAFLRQTTEPSDDPGPSGYRLVRVEVDTDYGIVHIPVTWRAARER